jgi:hypothetical protein
VFFQVMQSPVSPGIAFTASRLATGGSVLKKAVIFGDKKAGIIEVPDPIPTQDWALVKVHASAMCTEYNAFEAGLKRDAIGPGC